MVQKLTKEQALIVSGMTGICCISPFSLFHEDIEKRLGRPVFTHELASKEVMDEIQDAYKEDFLAMCYVEEE